MFLLMLSVEKKRMDTEQIISFCMDQAEMPTVPFLQYLVLFSSCKYLRFWAKCLKILFFFQGSLCVHFYGNKWKIVFFKPKYFFFILKNTIFFFRKRFGESKLIQIHISALFYRQSFENSAPIVPVWIKLSN